jgi:hypothetical protein
MYTMKTIYGLNPEDVWWSASDLGWVVGHSYIAYGPLLFGKIEFETSISTLIFALISVTGCTSVMYEGKPGKYFL